MRKLISLFLAALLVLSLGSCGEETAPGATSEPFAPSEPPATTQPVSTQPVSIQPVSTQPTRPEETEPPEIVMPEPDDAAMVPVSDYIPGLIVELRYATEYNFTGQKIYDFRESYLRYGTVKKLLAAQQFLTEQGLGLKLWDGFRPVSAQFALWEVCPDPRYVADPRQGFSSHSRGNTVDITLVDSTGRELEMPTDFDDFSSRADRDYSDCPEEAAKNARLLQQVMEEAGFTGYWGEWWHYSDTDSYEVESVFEPMALTAVTAHCDAFITLRTAPDLAAPEITRIPAEDTCTAMARSSDFYYVYYRGLRGYVLIAYTRQAS